VLKIIRPGLLTTIQDPGRWGMQAIGIPVAGPMDEYSHRYANRLLGNRDEDAALEITMTGPEIEAGVAVTCAVTGARFDITVDGRPVPLDAPFDVPASGRLRFGNRAAGARATLAVRGGFDVAAAYGSRATSLTSGIGPLGGRALRAGDILPVGRHRPSRMAAMPDRGLRLPAGGVRLRVLDGPHAHMFVPAARGVLLGSRFVVTTSANRMGYRLEGPPLEQVSPAGHLLSAATPAGTLQVPASGQPILLMADRQTTGGYPKIATVITADLPLAGQLSPGDWIQFELVTRAEAVEALSRQAGRLEGRP
jgi:antagonist of KipI